jgi:hypothetical protein
MEKLPDEAQELELHTRLLAGDKVASDEVARAFLLPVVERLRRRFRRLDDETLVQDAASDAILSYVERPAQYNPKRKRLLGYLVMSADGDLRNALDSQRRRATREVTTDSVELYLEARNIDWEEANEVGEHDDDAMSVSDIAEVKRKVAEVITDPVDLRLVELMLRGERRTKAFAKVLGIAALDELEQRRIVKQAKDRLKKRLVRLGVRLRERG